MRENNATQTQGERYHILKTDPDVFQAVLSGAKTFEIRLNDRGYAVGDVLGLRETKHPGAEMRAGAPLVYTGRECQRFVSHVLTGYGLADGWCCLSFRLPHAAGESAPIAHQDAASLIEKIADSIIDNFRDAGWSMPSIDSARVREAVKTAMLRNEGLASAPVAGEPFMYGIMGPDGKAHFEEFCVSSDRDELQAEVVDHLNRDNPEDGSYSVVALFRDAAPQASAPNAEYTRGRADGFDAGHSAALEKAVAALEDHRKAGREWVPGSLWDNLSREAAARIRALKPSQASNGRGDLMTDAVVLPPLPAELRDTETHSRQYAHDAVLLDRLTRARAGESHV